MKRDIEVERTADHPRATERGHFEIGRGGLAWVIVPVTTQAEGTELRRGFGLVRRAGQYRAQMYLDQAPADFAALELALDDLAQTQDRAGFFARHPRHHYAALLARPEGEKCD